MVDEPLNKIEALFHETLALDPADRASFLETRCSDDPSLKAEVESLLIIHGKAPLSPGQPAWMRFLESPSDSIEAACLEPDPDLPFERLGEYKLICRLGEGGMGVVYLAVQESLKRQVALKVIRPERVGSMEVVTRFWREIDAISKLNHPNIVRVYGSGVDKDVHYFSMELVPGRGLDEVLREALSQGEKIPTTRVLGWFRELAEALDYAHQVGIIHRDVKPSNIRITSTDQAMLMDFGIARHMDLSTLTLTGEFRGTPHYASPEQVKAGKGRKIDVRTDNYSLGVTLYEAVAGRVPFVGETTEQIFQQILEGEPVPPRRLNPSTSRDLDTVILVAMDKEVERRYATMSDFAEDLRRVQEGEVILAKPAGFYTRTWKRMKQNPVLSTAVTVVILAALFFESYTLFVYHPRIKAEQARTAEALKVTESKKEQALAAEKEASYQRDIAEEEKERALAAKQESDRLREIAEEGYYEIIRLSDVKRLTDLETEAEELWPAYPEKAEALEEWVEKAEILAGRLDDHRETLKNWREKVLAYSEDEVLDNSGAGGKGPAPFGAEKETADLDQAVSGRRTWKFESLETLQWRHDTLYGLVLGLEALLDDETGTLKDVKERLEYAKTVKERTILDYITLWEEAIASIADEEECPQYEGLVIEPKIGFVPIDQDPDSGLWEFAHLQTGEIPFRDTKGRLFLDEKMGLVFVLIPGGTFDMGAVWPTRAKSKDSPHVDPDAGTNEGPVHEVTVKPFFLSKYEMTQGQWQRFTKSNPSLYGPGANVGGQGVNLLHPVEQVSWEDCADILFKLKLRLPSESEWEYAASAGASTIFWTGNKKESLQGAANLGDLYLKSNVHQGLNIQCEESLNDGYGIHASVGSFLANLFGLHDIHGNVWEWCEDIYGSYKNSPTDGSANTKGSTNRVNRGGGWYSNAFHCRLSHRSENDPIDRDVNLGLRPAASVFE